MKTTFLLLALSSGITLAYGQGQVKFYNPSTTLITTNSVIGGPPTGPVSGSAASYWFGLFMAPAGTTDPNSFTFTGFYATNRPPAGRIDGGTVTIYETSPNPGDYRAFLVRGWSANIGTDYAAVANYLANPTFTGWYGESQIANVMLGGDFSYWPLFGDRSDQIPGFNLDMVPEPSVLMVGGLGFGVFLLLRRRVKQR